MKLLKSKTFIVLSVLIILYLIGGFLILPAVLGPVLVEKLAPYFSKPVTITKLRFNPVVFSAQIEGFRIGEENADPHVEVESIYANVSILPLLFSHLVVEEVRITAPVVRVERSATGEIDLIQLLQIPELDESEGATNDGTRASGGSFKVSLKEFALNGGTIYLSDQTVGANGFKNEFRNLIILCSDFSTEINEEKPTRAKIAVDFATGAKLTIETAGQFLLPAKASSSFLLEGLNIPGWSVYTQALTPLLLESGRLDLSGSIDLSYANSPSDTLIVDAALKLSDFILRDPELVEAVLNMGEFSVTGIKYDHFGHSLQIGQVLSTGTKTRVHRDADGNIKWAGYLNPGQLAKDTEEDPPSGLESNGEETDQIVHSRFEFVLDNLQISDHSIHWTDDAIPDATELRLADLKLELRNLSPGGSDPTEVSLQVQVQDVGLFSLEGLIGWDPRKADIFIDLDGFDLTPLSPYTSHYAGYGLNSGLFSLALDTKATLSGKDWPKLEMHGNAGMENLSIMNAAGEETLFSLSSFELDDIYFESDPEVVRFEKITIDKPFLDIRVDPQGNVNLLPSSLTSNADIPDRAVEGKAGSESEDEDQVQDQGRGEGQDSLNIEVGIKSLTITNGGIHLNDQTVDPNFSTSLQDLNFDLDDFNWGDAESKVNPSKFKLTGKWDEHTELNLNGTLNFSQPAKSAQWQIVLENLEMPPFSGYSGKFLGYSLEKGKLNLNLDYTLQDKQLKGSNRAVFDQFNLGGKVESDKAIKLPLKLAISVMKDSSGRINLDVPVAGQLDDPEFKLGKVIGMAISNVITKIVTSPFSFLGSVFGSKEDLSFVQFEPGNHELTAESLEKLATLVKALNGRPLLHLQIEVSANEGYDVLPLKKRILQAKVIEHAGLSGSPDTKDPEDPKVEDSTEINDRLYREYLASYYETVFPEETMDGLATAPGMDVIDSEEENVFSETTEMDSISSAGPQNQEVAVSVEQVEGKASPATQVQVVNAPEESSPGFFRKIFAKVLGTGSENTAPVQTEDKSKTGTGTETTPVVASEPDNLVETVDTGAAVTSTSGSRSVNEPGSGDMGDGNLPRVETGDSAPEKGLPEMEVALLDTITVSKELFFELSGQRTREIQDYLVETGGIDVSRIFILEPESESSVPKQDGGVGATQKDSHGGGSLVFKLKPAGN